jgi:hypothetical protein
MNTRRNFLSGLLRTSAILALAPRLAFGDRQLAKSNQVEVIDSISKAVAAAKPGDTVVINPGRYREKFSIVRSGVHLYCEKGAEIHLANSLIDDRVDPVCDMTIRGQGHFTVEKGPMIFVAGSNNDFVFRGTISCFGHGEQITLQDTTVWTASRDDEELGRQCDLTLYDLERRARICI